MRLRDLMALYLFSGAGSGPDSALSDEAGFRDARVSPRASDAILSRNFYTPHQRCWTTSATVGCLPGCRHLNSPAGGGHEQRHSRCTAWPSILFRLRGTDPSLLARYDRRRQTIARDEVQRLSARSLARHRESRADQRQAIWDLETPLPIPGGTKTI